MRGLLISLALVVLAVALAAVPAAAFKKGTFEYGGYTITVTPDNPAHPSWSGGISIVGSSEYGDVSLAGRYDTTERPHPVLSVTLSGIIVSGEETYEVEEKTWTFVPRETHMVWRVVIAWVDSLLDRG